jgi:tRNA(Ile)-lysidine synthase
VDALVTDWHGQGPVALPAALEAGRRSGRLHIADSASETGNGAQLRR